MLSFCGGLSHAGHRVVTEQANSVVRHEQAVGLTGDERAVAGPQAASHDQGRQFGMLGAPVSRHGHTHERAHS